MSLRSRLVLLLLLLAATGVLAIGALELAQRREATTRRDYLKQDSTHQIELLMGQTSRSLRQFSEDYSQWTEMADFIARPTPGWTEVNLRSSFDRFDVDFGWVLDPAGRLVARCARSSPSDAAPDLPDGCYGAILQNPYQQFYWNSPVGLLELRTAAVHLSEDVSHEGEARGYLIVARWYDWAYLAKLAGLLLHESKITVEATPSVANEDESLVIARPLMGLDGRPVSYLHIAVKDLPKLESEVDEGFEMLAAVVPGMLAISLVGLLLRRWIMRPMHQIERSLAQGSAEPLGQLAEANDEFGRIARHARAAFADKASLERHIDDRERLARDLHDGVIQSLFATGLVLGALETTPPPGADPEWLRKLSSSRQRLADIVLEVRNFLQNVETPHRPPPFLASALEALLTEARDGNPGIQISCRIHEGTAHRLSPAQGVELLQIAREAVSNAQRHAGARYLTLTLDTSASGYAQLTVSDDGAGFDSHILQHRTGRGLKNLADRTSAMGGTLHIDSRRGFGTRVRVEFPIDKESST